PGDGEPVPMRAGEMPGELSGKLRVELPGRCPCFPAAQDDPGMQGLMLIQAPDDRLAIRTMAGAPDGALYLFREDSFARAAPGGSPELRLAPIPALDGDLS